MELFLAIIFLGATIFFGYVLGRYVLGENRVFALIPVSVILGINGYIFLVNASSYIIPIRINVWIMLILVVVLSVGIFIYRRQKVSALTSVFTTRQLRFLFIMATLISLSSGLIAIKSLALDDLNIAHLPLARTIAEGNFPVVDPSAPSHIFSSHYGPDLATAILNIITQIPLWLGYDLQTFLFSGFLFLMLFVLVYDITKRYCASLVASLLFLFGTGFQWLYFFTEGIPVLWQRYVGGEVVIAPWRFLADVAFPQLNTSYIYSMHNHSIVVGVPMLILALWLYFKSLSANTTRQSIVYVVFSSISYAYVALHLEPHFVITAIAFLTLLVIAFIDRWLPWFGDTFSLVRSKVFLRNTIVLLVISVGLSLVQGGIITSLLYGSDNASITFVKDWQEFTYFNLAPDPAGLNDPSTFIYLLSFDFFVQFGLPLLLIIPALVYFIRRRNGEFLFLAIIGLGAFVVPYLFRLPSRNWEMSRFFLIAIPLFCLIIGVFLEAWYRRAISSFGRRSIVILGILVGLTGVISHFMFAVSNLDRFGQLGPLIMRPPAPSTIDALAYSWVNTNTTLKDRFFPYDPNFILYTGRYTPGAPYNFTFSHRNVERAWYNKIIAECSPEAFRFFGINYLYVSPEFPIKNPVDCFKKLKAQQVYEFTSGVDYRQVYTFPSN
ncbi:MAG: hypothetical protein A2566_02215 [Candidatus Zambryskibacteria bacterium RIFOXYD1_FULL_40_13]|nr:MAG: hypothetical protein UT25_C0003G0044 [Parcubacteria group bacterium GW2011_GWC1_39_12]KKR35595.1 MAG: hypothetical protein UT68_C0002G0021 [Parcubacteria group bacterium GW2011_GWC2_40_10]KKR52006.1 MAG: hypothetical protein UT89_C0004G0092 [Parcubacteria group bacterium GW2011_GWE1_40_20]KKS35918.1 MAG: hypothetical protein UU99_C0003G0093 [Parcubacteria group bacterium GW2011_GWE2_42_14]OHB15733.1 MAG: hypothetical protein A2566_02215 [Candidatus Zambryskibacteria bacterium RIFOXYD1_F